MPEKDTPFERSFPVSGLAYYSRLPLLRTPSGGAGGRFSVRNSESP